MARTIALVEDDAIIRENLKDFLGHRGFDVRGYADAESAIAGFRVDLPDLAVLDVALGDEREGGFQVCSELRRLSQILPIVFLTSYDGEADRISGLRLGADDYLSKESSFDFLVVRLEALLARHRALRQATDTAAHRTVGSLSLDTERSQASWRSQLVDLPLTQYWIVAALAASPGEPKSHDELMKAARIHVAPNTIAAHVKSIRERFRSIDPDFDAIRTERGLGYRWIET